VVYAASSPVTGLSRPQLSVDLQLRKELRYSITHYRQQILDGEQLRVN